MIELFGDSKSLKTEPQKPEPQKTEIQKPEVTSSQEQLVTNNLEEKYQQETEKGTSSAVLHSTMESTLQVTSDSNEHLLKTNHDYNFDLEGSSSNFISQSCLVTFLCLVLSLILH